MLLLPISFYSFFGDIYGLHALCIESRMDCHFFNSPNNSNWYMWNIGFAKACAIHIYKYTYFPRYIYNVCWVSCVCCARGMNVVRIDLFCSVLFSSVWFCYAFVCVCVCVCVFTWCLWPMLFGVLTAHPFKLLLPLPCINVSHTICVCTRIAMPTS